VGAWWKASSIAGLAALVSVSSYLLDRADWRCGRRSRGRDGLLSAIKRQGPPGCEMPHGCPKRVSVYGRLAESVAMRVAGCGGCRCPGSLRLRPFLRVVPVPDFTGKRGLGQGGSPNGWRGFVSPYLPAPAGGPGTSRVLSSRWCWVAATDVNSGYTKSRIVVAAELRRGGWPQASKSSCLDSACSGLSGHHTSGSRTWLLGLRIRRTDPLRLWVGVARSLFVS